VVVELPEESMYAFFERCLPEGNRAVSAPSISMRNPRPNPGAYRLAPSGVSTACVALDDCDARERLIALLAN